jgi:hypothetical protein
MDNRITRQGIAAIAALVGGYLLHLSASPEHDFGTVLPAFWAGVILFVGVAWLLLRYYHPGTEEPSADEVDIREWRFIRFLHYGRDAAPLYLGLRLFLASEWLEAGWSKVTNPAWVQTGDALRAYWERAECSQHHRLGQRSPTRPTVPSSSSCWTTAGTPGSPTSSPGAKC